MLILLTVLSSGLSVDNDVHLHLHLGLEQLKYVVCQLVTMFFQLGC